MLLKYSPQSSQLPPEPWSWDPERKTSIVLFNFAVQPSGAYFQTFWCSRPLVSVATDHQNTWGEQNFQTHRSYGSYTTYHRGSHGMEVLWRLLHQVPEIEKVVCFVLLINNHGLHLDICSTASWCKVWSASQRAPFPLSRLPSLHHWSAFLEGLKLKSWTLLQSLYIFLLSRLHSLEGAGLLLSSQPTICSLLVMFSWKSMFTVT